MTGLFLVIVGVWLFTQVVLGDLLGRITSFASEEAGAIGATATSTRARTRGRGRVGSLRKRPGVPRGAGWVFERAAAAAEATGHRFVVISWLRPTSIAPSGKASYHACRDDTTGSLCVPGKRGCKCGRALDIQPEPESDGSIDWTKLDDLVAELRTYSPTELIWRGDADHDEALGARDPHAHVAWRN